jgi:UDP-glucose-4-epimerase GalE
LPLDETDTPLPINPYGKSKLAVERCLEDYSLAYGIKTISLRYFNAGGADPDGEIGEVHDPEPHLIPRVLAVANSQEPHITIFGTDHDTPDGTCIRDYVHVADIARAHVRAVDALDRLNGYSVFNLGSGAATSIKELIAAAERVCGRPIAVRHSARRPGDPANLVASHAKASSVLGWHPELSDMDTILRSAWTWMKSRE